MMSLHNVSYFKYTDTQTYKWENRTRQEMFTSTVKANVFLKFLQCCYSEEQDQFSSLDHQPFSRSHHHNSHPEIKYI